MKTKQITTITLSLFMALLFAGTARAECNENDMNCCTVTNPKNPTDGDNDSYSGSFDLAMKGFQSNIECRNRIEFDVNDPVQIYKSYTLDKVISDGSSFQIGNGDSANDNGDAIDGTETTFEVHDLEEGDAIFVLDGSKGLKNVSIRNIVVNAPSDGSAASTLPLISCKNGVDTVTLEKITLSNTISKPISIDGCLTVHINHLIIKNGIGDANGLIYVTNQSLGFELTNSEFTNMIGSGVTIDDNSDGFKIDTLDMTYDTDASAAVTGIKIDDSYGTLSSPYISNIKGTGLVIKNLSDGGNAGFSNITLQGTLSSNTGDGVVIENSSHLNFNTGIYVTGFGSNGVVVKGNSTFNEFSADTISVFENGYEEYINEYKATLAAGANVDKGHGFVFQTTADGSPEFNTVSNAWVTDNYNCGVYFDTDLNNWFSHNNLANNDDCGAYATSTSSVKMMDAGDVTILSRGITSILLDINTDAIDGRDIKRVELHSIVADESSYSGNTYPSGPPSASSTSRTKKAATTLLTDHSLQIKKGVASTLRYDVSAETTALDFNSGTINLAVTSPLGQRSSAPTSTFMRSMPPAPSGDESYISSFDIGQMPVDSTDGLNNVLPGASFMVMVYDSNDYVIGIWKGTAKQAAADVSSDNTDCSGQGCYYDDETKECFRVFDLTSDTDGDGLYDFQEDPDMDCKHGDGETYVDIADSDTDSINDGNEINVTKTEPLDSDSDEDGLSDGAEIASQVTANVYTGSYSTSLGETDPNNPDTDGDGLNDGDEFKYGTNPNDTDSDDDTESDSADKCPLISGDTNCYYSHCIPTGESYLASLSADVIAGVDATAIDGLDGDDQDGDGVYSQLEDANGNCTWDTATETNAASPDTDLDGLCDGSKSTSYLGVTCVSGEDLNDDGFSDITIGESNPLSTDTDGDLVADSLEMAHSAWYAGSGKGDRTLIDTDSDLISDGDEDSSASGNLNGVVDKGETDPSLTDTDGDGLIDSPEPIAVCAANASGFEVCTVSYAEGTDPCPWNTDQNCVVRYCGINGYESYDAENDGLPDVDEDFNGDCAWSTSELEPSPLVSDTDGEGLNDSQEVDCFGTNPIAVDTDADGRTDYSEVENSIDQCHAMFNLGDSDPTRAEYGGCSLNTNSKLLATSQSQLTIMIMMTVLAALAGLRYNARKD